jgi:hypothetical protein
VTGSFGSLTGLGDEREMGMLSTAPWTHFSNRTQILPLRRRPLVQIRTRVLTNYDTNHEPS